MKKFIAALLALPLLLSGSEAIKLNFQEGAKHIYEFSGYFPFPLIEELQGKRIKVTGQLQLEIEELLSNGEAFVKATLSEFEADTETEFGNYVTNAALKPILEGGCTTWKLDSKGRLLEFSSDSFFFSAYANQILALGLFCPLLRGALEEGRSAVARAKGLDQFEIEYEAVKTADNHAIIGFKGSSEKVENGRHSHMQGSSRGTFNLKTGWAREAWYDIRFQHEEMKNREENHFTFWITRIDNSL